MHKNVENVLERDRKLGDLEERADALQDGCAQFEKQAAAMKNKFWMENLKAIIAGSVVGLIVLGLIHWKFFMDDNHYAAPPQGYYPQGGPPAEPAGDAGAGDAGDAAPPAEEAPTVNDVGAGGDAGSSRAPSLEPLPPRRCRHSTPQPFFEP